MNFNQLIASSQQRSRATVLLLLFGALTGCTPRPLPQALTGIASFQFPMCSRVDADNMSLDPPYAHSAQLLVPAKDVKDTEPAMIRKRDKDADPKSVGVAYRPDLGIFTLRMVIRDVGKSPPISDEGLVFDGVEISSAPGVENVAFSFRGLTWEASPDSYEFVDGVLKMKKNLEIPLFKNPTPENGFWIYERPAVWIWVNGERKSNTSSYLSRVYVPVGFEKQVVIGCHHDSRPPHSAMCKVHTLLPLPQVRECGGAHLRYWLAYKDFSKWREIDTRLRQRINGFIADPSKRFGDLIPDVSSTK